MKNNSKLKQIVSKAVLPSALRRNKISHAEAYKRLVKKLKTKLLHYIAPNASMYTSSLMQS